MTTTPNNNQKEPVLLLPSGKPPEPVQEANSPLKNGEKWTPESERDNKTGRFVPGYQGGPGRPKGSTKKLKLIVDEELAEMGAKDAQGNPVSIERALVKKIIKSIFGYDRDSGLCRIFSPRPLIKLFRELNDANNALFDTLRKKGPQAVSLLTPQGTRPTRMNVVLKEELMVVAGGVNYFPLNPTHASLDELDKQLGTKDSEKDISLAEAEKILRLISVEKTDLWNQHSFADCVETLRKTAKYNCRLIVRTERSISKGTGTLLSPTDRKIGEDIDDRLVLTMYRLKGEATKGWEDRPLWVPNIKFPDGTYFYYQLK